MMERLEQWYCNKLCQKLGDSQVETIQKIQRVFGDDAMCITQIKDWYNRFKDGRTSVESDVRSDRSSTSRNEELIDQVRALAMQDCHVTVRELTEEVGLNTGSVHYILTDDLAFGRVSAKFVLKQIQTFLVKQNIPVVRQVHYSCDNWLFPHLKTQLKGTRFESRDDNFAENNYATRAAYTLSPTRWLHATDAVCWREKYPRTRMKVPSTSIP